VNELDIQHGDKATNVVASAWSCIAKAVKCCGTSKGQFRKNEEAMKTRRSMHKRLRFEDLERREVLSAMPGCPSSAVVPAVANSHAAVTAAKATVRAAPVTTLSSNWSGYAVTGAANSVSYVAGSWVEPAASPTTSGYSSVWVGIDGFSSSTVEQIGTEADVARGTVTYYAWYEMYPSYMVTIPNFTVKAGDSITASVQYDSVHQDFVLSIHDSTESESYTTTQSAPGAARSSAEWVVEAPSSNRGVLPLANFGTVTFSNAYATVNGTTGPIDNPGWQTYAINMASRSQVVAATSALTDSAAPAGDTPYAGQVSSFTDSYDGTSPSPVTPTPKPPTPPHHHRGGRGGRG